MGTHLNLMPLLLLAALASISISISAAAATALPGNPQTVASLSLPYIQFKDVENCSYTVVVTTSCASPNFTRDQISIAFGDAYGNSIYAKRLDDLYSGKFTKCSTDTFQLEGPCAQKICYAYLYRTGPDAWKPETVQIWSDLTGANATFFFNSYVPDDTWYGYNLCQQPSTPPPPYQPWPFNFTPPPPPDFHIPPPPSPPSAAPRGQAAAWWVVTLVLGFVGATL